MSILASTKRLQSMNWPVEEEIKPEPVVEPIFNDEHFELVDGFLVEKAMGIQEQMIDSQLSYWLGPFVRDHELGWTVVEGKFALPNTQNNRIPDLAFVSYATWPKSMGRPKGALWAIAPDLAIEVISPTDVGRDMMEKIQEYFTAGCKAVWIVWPNVEQIHVYSSPTSVHIFSRMDVLVGDPVVLGFRLELEKLFPLEEAGETPK